jgi:hypothetical protein
MSWTWLRFTVQVAHHSRWRGADRNPWLAKMQLALLFNYFPEERLQLFLPCSEQPVLQFGPCHPTIQLSHILTIIIFVNAHLICPDEPEKGHPRIWYLCFLFGYFIYYWLDWQIHNPIMTIVITLQLSTFLFNVMIYHYHFLKPLHAK